jgi:hypothetical protein
MIKNSFTYKKWLIKWNDDEQIFEAYTPDEAAQPAGYRTADFDGSLESIYAHIDNFGSDYGDKKTRKKSLINKQEKIMATKKQLDALKKGREARAKKLASKSTKKTTTRKTTAKSRKRKLDGVERKWVETGNPRFTDYIVIKGSQPMKRFSSLVMAKRHAERLKGKDISITLKVVHNLLKLV